MIGLEFGIATVAAMLSPLIALQVQRRLDREREKLSRQRHIFDTLMATRNALISPEHVQALNRIDLEFYKSNALFGKSTKEILVSWRMLLDHLNTQVNPDNLAVWDAQRVELFLELLYQMSKYLRYDFDKVYLKRTFYAPVAHFNQEDEDRKMRLGLMGLLSGELPLSIRVVASDAAAQDQVVIKALPPELDGNYPRPISVNGQDDHNINRVSSG